MLITHVPMMQDSMADTIGNASGRMVTTNSSNAQFYPNEVGGPLGHYFHSLNTAVIFNTNYSYLEKFSLAFWFNPTYVAQTDWSKIISIGEVSNINNRIRLEAYGLSGTPMYGFFGNSLLNGYGGSIGSISKTDYPEGIWVHLILTFEILDRDNVEIKFYANNVLKSNLKISWTIAPHESLIIGGDLQQQVSNFADVRVYNHILSDYERDEIYRKRLICQYSFDSTGDSISTYDVSTMGNNAEFCNASVSLYNKIGYSCAEFNGSQYIRTPASLKLTDRFTCNFWGYMDDWTTYTSMRMISCTESGGWNIEDSGQNIWFSCYDGLAKTYQGAGFVAKSSLTSGWHMFTCQFDGTNAKFYIDGQLKCTSKNYQDAPNGKISYNSGNRIFIGCEAAGNTSPGGQYFNGRIDDFKMYAGVLTTEDIQKEYKVRAIVDDHHKLFTKWLNEVEVGYSKYNLISGVLSIGASTTQKPSPDMNFYEFASGGNPIVWYTTKVKPKPNHKYYASIVWRTLSGFTVGDNRFEWWCGDGANQNMIFAFKVNTNGQARKLSNIKSLATVADGDWRMRNFTVNGSTKAWTSDPILVDLTEIFGAGNEPDLAWCDKNIIIDPVNLIDDPSFENTIRSTSGDNGTSNIVDFVSYEGTKSLELNAIQAHELTNTFNNVTYWRPMHRYYWGAWIKKDSGDATTGQIYMQPETTTREPFQGAFSYGPADGNWYYCSFITRDACFTHDNFVNLWNQTYGKASMRIDVDNKAKVYYDNLQQIDLTALYGWGNEPTLAECNKLFGYKNANIQFCDGKGVTNINQISEMGRPMRYIRIISTGSNKNGANHIIQACAETVDNGKIMLADATNFPNDKMKATSGLTNCYTEATPYYWNESGTTVIFDLGKIDFVASVFLKRYYPDSRYYYGTKIEGSLDKSTWFTIWDSHNTGSYGSDNQYNTYVETDQGRTFIVEPDKMYVTDKGTIIVNEIEEY